MPQSSLLLVFVFAVPPLGAWWMIYMAIRYEKNPLPMILLAFLPYTFVWYYFERVRTGKHLARTDASDEQTQQDSAQRGADSE